MTTTQRVAAIEHSIEARLGRVRKRILPAFQVAIAAGLAYFIAHEIIGHKQPFFAPISVVIIVGLSGGERINRAFDMSLGCVLAVLVGDLFFAPLGTGVWQIALAVGVSLLFASFFSKSLLVANQVAIGSILIQTIMQPGAEVTGIDRTVDAFIGSLVGLAVVALVPSAPLSSARQEIANVLKILSSVLDDVSDGLRDQQPAEMAIALEEIRSTQAGIDAITTATKSGRESSRLSPFLWGSRRYVESLSRTVTPTDNAIRTTRVLARRALVLVEDKDTVSEQQLAILDELSAIALELSEIFEVNSRISQAEGMPALVSRLRDVAAETGMDVLQRPIDPAQPDGEKARPALSAAVILAQSRSLIVDLLQVCGWSRESAIAVLVPTSDHPAYPPEYRRRSANRNEDDSEGPKEDHSEDRKRDSE